jgi:hypothetical protein
MAYFKHLSAFVFASLLALTARGEALILDSFESGDMSATNTEGFGWAANNKTSVVTADNEVFNNGEKNAPIPNGKNWRPKTGEHSLKFLYPSDESWTEQRFAIGGAYPEIWMSFWLRVPTNFTHPAKEGWPDNQKLFFLWMDGYSTKGEGSSVGMEFRGNGLGGSYFYAKISRGGNTGTGIDTGQISFLDIPADRGKWMHLVVHVASESTAGANDGLMEVWRKWEGDSQYMKTHDLKDQPISISSSVKGFANGYLMGWANTPYPVDTEFLLDDFALSTSPLLEGQNAPTAPTGLVIE